jgi:hypothetical protein
LKRLIKPREAVVIIVALIILVVIISGSKSPSRAAEITVTAVSGKQVFTVDLTKNRRFSLESLTGTHPPDMEFEVSDGDIRVIKSGCPGGDCVHQGFASENGGVIICVPNRITVILSDTEKAYDAIVG